MANLVSAGVCVWPAIDPNATAGPRNWPLPRPGVRSVHLALAALPVRRAQLELLELAGGRSGELFALLHARGALVVRQVRAAVFDQFTLRDGRAGNEDDEALHRPPPLLVGHADHRRLRDLRV